MEKRENTKKNEKKKRKYSELNNGKEVRKRKKNMKSTKKSIIKSTVNESIIKKPMIMIKNKEKKNIKIEEIYKIFPKSKNIFQKKDNIFIEFSTNCEVENILVEKKEIEIKNEQEKENKIKLKIQHVKNPKRIQEKEKKDKIFISNLNEKINEQDLKKLFLKHGDILNLEIKKKYENRNFCFLKFKSNLICNQIISSPFKLNLNQKELKIEKLKKEIIKNDITFQLDDSIFISNFDKNIKQDDILNLFKSNEIHSIFFPNSFKIYSLIQFKNEKSTKLAIESLNNFKLKGNILKVNLFNENKN
eukprot:gene1214-11304_t